MSLLNSGRDILAQLCTGNSAVVFNNANAHIGIGDSNAAFAVTQTDLQATSNKVRVGMDASYPTSTANVLVFQSTFGSAVGNFAWNEWGVFNSAAGATMLNRVVEYNGTKLAGQTWIFQVTLTLTIGA